MAKKLKKFKVRLHGSLPCSAEMIVHAANEDDARAYADERPQEADWSGADYDSPDYSLVEIGSVEEIE